MTRDLFGPHKVSASDIYELEEAGALAWPSLETQDCDDWILRFAGCYTNRANSAFTLHCRAAVSTRERLRMCRDYYRERSCRALVQVSPVSRPIDLLEQLLAVGASATNPIDVLIREVEGKAPVHTEYDISLTDEPTKEWLTAWRTAENMSEHSFEVGQRILSLVSEQSTYALATSSGRLLGVGRVVLHKEWAGYYNVAVASAFRRRGIAGSVMQALASWAIRSGARREYLQVDSDNIPAKSLYDDLAFRAGYRFRFWQIPTDAS